ncbi:MAG TPA: SpoIIE family protein phosphatase [Mycobacterium sp.]|jgi:hypothetical protein|nr:phosphoserine phosphatase RsbU/P [Actinomycetota bacterium]HNP12215.1 SpoIIE family protein phosphatase [Mycobacterium sp.]HRD10330.1 SpoIIE family protein phosphatase [Mycobacterium sp.]
MSEQDIDRYALAPEVEAERLRSLAQLHVFRSPPEDRYAHITHMACTVLGVPLSAILFIDEDSQWCKQFSGDIEPDFDVPRSDSACRATIARAYHVGPDDLAVIHENLAETEFAQLPAVAAEGGVRFYASHPLFGPGGHPVGTFCVYDFTPRQISAKDKKIFAELAAWAQRELANSNDLQRAADVQRQLLPAPLGGLPGYSLTTVFTPAFSVAGDFYDHYPVPGGLNVTVADVMGKGLGSAIVAATVRSALRASSQGFDRDGHHLDLSAAIESVDEMLVDDFSRTDTFVTLFHLYLESDTGLVSYIDAGHGIAALLRRSGEIEGLRSDDLPLGTSFGSTWQTRAVAMHPGDMLVIASDGLLDLLDDHAVVDDALQFLAGHTDPAQLCSAVAKLTETRLATDDITIVALRREG